MSVLTFVIPVCIKKTDEEGIYQFRKTLKSIELQSSKDWSVVIIDDNSQNDALTSLLDEFKTNVTQSIIVHQNMINLRPGASRNIGINIAKEDLKSDYVMFIDADDINNLSRVEETHDVINHASPDVIYSHFIPVDSNDVPINIDELSYSIQHIMLALLSPPSGSDVWKEMLLGKGYINLTSSTTVKTDLAMKFPFSEDIHCEDACTWLQYGMYGADFYYTPNIPSLYRIPNAQKGSISREYIGNDSFYTDFVKSVIRGLNAGIPYLISKGITDEYIKLLVVKYVDLVESILKQEGVYYINDKIENMMIGYKKSNEIYLREDAFILL
ncbi:MAG: glycosyltransferase family 2 protein [Oscillospiraceae bacterium]|nr:glycosyltransferase family 2 protein [Oscillospiraceae bacterium]